MMRRILTTAMLALAPATASAVELPEAIDFEVCWFGLCNDVTYRVVPIVNAPVLNPDGGQLWNSQGHAGDFLYDPLTGDLLFAIYAFPGALYTGLVDADGCVEGTASDLGTYTFLGDFFSVECP